MRWDGQAQFHPTRYLKGLAASLPGEGCHVFEGSRVTDWDPHRIQTEAGSVRLSAARGPEAVAKLLEQAGFLLVTTDTNLRRIHKAQASHFGLFKAIARGLQHRYAIIAQKAH